MFAPSNQEFFFQELENYRVLFGVSFLKIKNKFAPSN